ncbi:MAG: hypothetical protein GYB41_12300 [Oceanospirillales bacterium]|nr:hypothetical protein [Oceanospirillales bacterium]
MLTSLFNSRHERLLKAIIANDPDKVAHHLSKLDAEQLSVPGSDGRHALELALTDSTPRTLELLLNKAARPLPPARCGTPLVCLALQHSDSLPRLTLLLQAGEDPNLIHSQRPLLHQCVEHCETATLMLHLSRLLQHGADIDQPDANGCTLLQGLLANGDLPLLQFLLQSGAHCEEEWLTALEDVALATRLKRVLDDLRIRQMMLGG